MASTTRRRWRGSRRFPRERSWSSTRGYTDFAWFADLTAAGIFFVTRLKRNADYTVIERRTPPQDRGIVCDQIIRVQGPVTRRRYPGWLRRVVYRTADGDRLEFLTNHLTLGASTVADLQGPVADRTVSQSVEAEPADQDLRRDIG